MPMFAMVVPIPQGKLEAWRGFVKQLQGVRRAEFEASRKQLGVRERTFLQQTPQGDFCIVTLEGNDPTNAITKFGKSNDSFAKWFVEQVKQIHNLDLSQPLPGPQSELVIDTQEMPAPTGAQ
jgi:hypothetical protein